MSGNGEFWLYNDRQNNDSFRIMNYWSGIKRGSDGDPKYEEDNYFIEGNSEYFVKFDSFQGSLFKATAIDLIYLNRKIKNPQSVYFSEKL